MSLSTEVSKRCAVQGDNRQFLLTQMTLKARKKAVGEKPTAINLSTNRGATEVSKRSEASPF